MSAQGAAKWVKKNLQKVFPDHWSFMLGEIALYSFIILLLSGTFLTFLVRSITRRIGIQRLLPTAQWRQDVCRL